MNAKIFMFKNINKRKLIIYLWSISSLILLPSSLTVASIKLEQKYKSFIQIRTCKTYEKNINNVLEYCYEIDKNKYEPFNFYTEIYQPYLKNLFPNKFNDIKFEKATKKYSLWTNEKKSLYETTIKNARFVNDQQNAEISNLSTDIIYTIKAFQNLNFNIDADAAPLSVSVLLYVIAFSNILSLIGYILNKHSLVISAAALALLIVIICLPLFWIN